jgi:hypothetical protein
LTVPAEIVVAGKVCLAASNQEVSMTRLVVEVGQKWSVWVPGRQQWLLATVIRRFDGRATLKYDPRYMIGIGYDERSVDESSILTGRSLFRLVEGSE